MKYLYYILFGVLYMMSLLPLWILYRLSDMMFLLVFYLVRYRRRVTHSNLVSSFPEKSEKEILDIEKAFYAWFCDYIVETIKMLTISEKEIKRRMVFNNTEAIMQTVENGQSCAMYLGHYCNWEWITSLPLLFDGKAQFGHVYHPLENEMFNDFFLRMRDRMGAMSISMKNILRKVTEFRRAGRTIVIGYISDQVPFWNSIHYWTDFLNHDTPVFTGAEKIVRAANHAVFYGDLKRPRRGYYTCDIKLLAQNPKDCKEFEVTEMYFRELEKTIRRSPQYWLWSHNRWKRTREEYDRMFYEQDGKIRRKE